MTCKNCTHYQKSSFGKGYCLNEDNERLFNKCVADWFSCNKGEIVASNIKYDITVIGNKIIKDIPVERLDDFYNSLSKMVEFQREHRFDTLLWIDDGKNDTYINNVKQEKE